MNDIVIRQVNMNDVNNLLSISRQTFVDTFAAYNTAENLATYLNSSLTLERLQQELLNNSSTFYFAELNGVPVGYLKINYGPGQTELHDDISLEVERIYVINSCQGKGVGQVLFTKACEVARQKGLEYIWLGVWEHNEKALAFYRKNGFEEFGRHIFKLGEDEQTDLMMRCRVGE